MEKTASSRFGTTKTEKKIKRSCFPPFQVPCDIESSCIDSVTDSRVFPSLEFNVASERRPRVRLLRQPHLGVHPGRNSSSGRNNDERLRDEIGKAVSVRCRHRRRTQLADCFCYRRPPASATSSTPSLPLLTTDALETPGSKEGEIKLVSSDGGTHAYSVRPARVSRFRCSSVYTLSPQWTGSSWENLGEVVDQDPALSEPPRTAPASKTLFEGDHYDFVFSIDVKDDEPPLKLPYNLSGTVWPPFQEGRA